MAGSDEERAFRQALGGFATGVVLVTTALESQTAGIVVNSFTSVSLRPRLVLWCLGDASDRYAHFAEAEVWAANVLSTAHQALSTRVSRPGSYDLSDVALDQLNGAPVLPGAVTQLACRTVERRRMGDHLVIVGAVEAYAAHAGDGLTYFRGRYGRAAQEE